MEKYTKISFVGMLIAFVCFFYAGVYARNVYNYQEITYHNNDTIHNNGTMPQTEGGIVSFDNEQKKWIKKNFKYPEEAYENGIQGRVLVKFYVNVDGSISDVKVVRSVHPLLDKEAVRIIKGMPKFKKAPMGGGRYVCYNVPFRLF